MRDTRVPISPELYHEVKVAAARHDMTVRDFVAGLLARTVLNESRAVLSAEPGAVAKHRAVLNVEPGAVANHRAVVGA